MRPDPQTATLHMELPLFEALRAEAADRDRDGAFPFAAFDVLRHRGHTVAPPLEDREIGSLLRLLAAVGRGDLPVGRIFEGHVNALALIRRYGTQEQRRRFDGLVSTGNILGIWNTDCPDNPLRLEEGKLVGAKNFASGVDGMSHAIVTVPMSKGRQMIIVPLEGLSADRSWWKPMGMRASGSHIVDFTGLTIEPEWVLGKPDDYLETPWFQAGAIRFAAVQVGGMHAVFSEAAAHLLRTKRILDPYQAHRIARMGAAVESGYGWLDRAAREWSAGTEGQASAQTLVATVNAARGVVEASALAVLEEAECGVGAAGLIAPHPLERLIRDLRTYLRQPNPDGALAALGKAIAEGFWEPGCLPPKERK